MHEQMGQNTDIKKILIKIDQLIDNGMHEEALNLIKSVEDDGKSSLPDKISCNLLKCKLLNQQGLNEEVSKIAESTYKDSLKLGKTVLSVDSLIIMARALIRLSELEKAFETLKKSEDLLNALKDISPREYQKREAFINLEKGRYYEYALDPDLSAEYINYSLKLREKLEDKVEFAISLNQLAWTLGVFKGELERAIGYLEQSLVIFKKHNIKHHIARGLNMMATMKYYQGSVDQSILLYGQSFMIHKELKNKASMAAVLTNMAEAYRTGGDLDNALECAKKSLVLFEEPGLLRRRFFNLDILIQILIEKGDLEQAQRYFSQLEHLNNQFPEKYINLVYLFNKVLLLKASPKDYDRDEAEEILIQLLEKEDMIYEFTVKSLLHLCELLLTKLSSTTNLKVLDQILFYVNQIRNIAVNSHSYWLLAETYLFQAKLELLILDLKKAKESLEEAQKIAKEHGLSQLNERILIEQDVLLNKANKWISLKNSTNSVFKFSNLTPLKEQIQYMLKKRQELKFLKI